MMKKLLLAAILVFAPASAWAQCSGVFPAATLCGNLGPTAAPPKAFPASGTVVGPGTTTVGHFATWANVTGTQLADFDLFGATNTWTGATNTYSNAVVFNGITTFNGNNTFATGISNFTGTFQIGGQTFTWPAAGTTVGGLGTAQTWTNTNTFSGTANFTGTPQLNGTSFASLWTGTNHAVQVGTGAVGNTSVGPGTLGQALISNGAADPSFKSGGWTLLNTVTGSGVASLDDTSSFTSSYAEYQIVFDNIVPVTNAVTLLFRIQSGGTFQSTGYIGNVMNSASTSVTGAATTASIQLSAASTTANTAPGFSGRMNFMNPTQTTTPKMLSGYGVYYNGTNMQTSWYGGYWGGGNGAITGIQVLTSSGNINGTFKVYGRL